MSHPAVTDAAVVGVKDDYAGELPRAYIVKNAKYNVTVDDIKKYVSGLFRNNFNLENIFFLKRFCLQRK